MADLLQKAYAHIDAGDFHLAIDILESLFSVDAMNVEAWEAYMQICGTCEELDLLCERVLQIAELNQMDRESILDYYYFLRKKMRSCGMNVESQKMITLELVDQFSFTLKDRNSISNGVKDHMNSEQRLAWFLGKVIIVPYIVLLAIGLNLLFTGINFGFWILMVLALSIFVGVWNIIFPVVKKTFVRKLEASGAHDDEIQYHPELIG